MKLPASITCIAFAAVLSFISVFPKNLGAGEVPAPVAKETRPRVVLITLDAFPAWLYDHPDTIAPNLKAFAAGGVRAPYMTVSNPTSTWSSHTTLVTGVFPRKHSVLFNGLIQRDDPGKPVSYDREATGRALVAVPNLFDHLHAEGLRTAAINWPCTRGSVSIEDNFPDTPNAVSVSTPTLIRELVASGVLPDSEDSSFRRLGQPGHDAMWTAAACHLIHKRMPDFLAIHLLDIDEVQHKHAPGTKAGFSSITRVDHCLGSILAALDAAGLRESTNVIVVSDHGCAPADKVICPNVLLRKSGLLTAKKDKITQARVHVRTLGGSAFVYCTDPATRDEDRKKAAEIFAGQEGIAEVVGPERFAELGLPDAGTKGAGELLLLAKVGYGIVNNVTGESYVQPATEETNLGFHGYKNDVREMGAIFVARGPGFKAGTTPGPVRSVDVAPTVMRLLGKKLPEADGRVLSEILVSP